MLRQRNQAGCRRRAAGDDGAALVEFALVGPFLFLMLFGIVEFGLNINDYQSIRQGARDGARAAVVANYGSQTSCGLNGPAASGSGTGIDNARRVICTTKDRAGVGNDLRVAVEVVPPAVSDPTDAAYDPRDHGSVKVCAVRQADSITGLIAPYLDNVFLETDIEMRAELSLTGPNELQSLAEADPRGGVVTC